MAKTAGFFVIFVHNRINTMKELRVLASAGLMLALVCSCGPKKAATYPVTANPYLPLWEHMPDGEPRVFEDPDNPGKYRVYVTGSHDVRFDSYCGQDDRQWSAPVEDLTAWRDEGPIFSYQENGTWSTMYAPDLVEVNRRDDGTRKYYLYPHSLMHMPMVAVGDRPDGPFTVLNVKDGQMLPGSVIGFDPGTLIDPVDDPADPDYNIGFRAYVAWGINRSSATELDQNTMYSPRRGATDYEFWIPSQLTQLLNSMAGKGKLSEQMEQFRRWANLPKDQPRMDFPAVAEGENWDDFNFFEASSFRKVGNKYIYLYSGHSGPEYGLENSNACLRYAYADGPQGPWVSGGVLVDARGPVLSRDGAHLETSFAGNNTHGSLAQINGQWYIFYHRAPRGFGFARQAMVAPVLVQADEKPVSEGGRVRITAYDPYQGGFTVKAADGNEYAGAEVTSEGFNMYGLDPYNYYSAGYACYMSAPQTMQDSWDIWDNRMDITGVKAGDVIGYKYFGFEGLGENNLGLRPFEAFRSGSSFNLFLTRKTDKPFAVDVWLDGPWEGGAWNGRKVARVEVPAGQAAGVERFTVSLDKLTESLKGKHALFLVAEGPEGEPLCDVIGLGFTRKGEVMEFPCVPTVQFTVNGAAVETPAFPVRATDQNGIMDYSLYELAVPAGTDFAAVQAVPSSKEVSVTRDDASRTISCTWKGVTKSYRIP